MRRWAEKHPLKRVYHNLRSHAKSRKKTFSLTFEEFKKFVEKTDHMAKKGRRSLSLQIDRKDETRGYHADNIQCLTLKENMRKRYVPFFRQYQERTLAETEAEVKDAYGDPF